MDLMDLVLLLAIKQWKAIAINQVMRWNAISGTIEEDGLSAREREDGNPFKVRTLFLILIIYNFYLINFLTSCSRMLSVQRW